MFQVAAWVVRVGRITCSAGGSVLIGVGVGEAPVITGSGVMVETGGGTLAVSGCGFTAVAP